MIIVDLVAGTSCDVWQASKVAPGRWSVGWGTCAPLNGDGRGPSGGATGAGVNTLAGVIRTFEMRNLHIPHALSIATDNSCSDKFRYPATKTDGKSSPFGLHPRGCASATRSLDRRRRPPGHHAGREGSRPGDADLRRHQPGQLRIEHLCRVQSPTGEADPYPAAGFDGDYYRMPHIPWSRLRVLR